MTRTDISGILVQNNKKAFFTSMYNNTNRMPLKSLG